MSRSQLAVLVSRLLRSLPRICSRKTSALLLPLLQRRQRLYPRQSRQLRLHPPLLERRHNRRKQKLLRQQLNKLLQLRHCNPLLLLRASAPARRSQQQRQLCNSRNQRKQVSRRLSSLQAPRPLLRLSSSKRFNPRLLLLQQQQRHRLRLSRAQQLRWRPRRPLRRRPR